MNGNYILLGFCLWTFAVMLVSYSIATAIKTKEIVRDYYTKLDYLEREITILKNSYKQDIDLNKQNINACMLGVSRIASIIKSPLN